MKMNDYYTPIVIASLEAVEVVVLFLGVVLWS
jgi:hypothetical protein